MSIGNDTPLTPHAALSWLIDMGADEAIGDEAVDRFASAPTSAPLPAAPQKEDVRQARGSTSRPTDPALIPRSLGEDPIADARAIAAACQTLDDVAAALVGFDACPLQRTSSNLVYIDGNPSARAIFIGEAPGREEDLQGKPFVGRSGQLLDRMFDAIGLSRTAEDAAQAALIVNVVFWRPPGNRKPTEAETLMCLPFIIRTLEIVDPEFIVCLGGTPAQRVLGVTDGILKLRGRWRTYPLTSRQAPLLPTLHPAYLLRNPAAKRLAWRDFLSLRKALDASPSRP